MPTPAKRPWRMLERMILELQKLCAADKNDEEAEAFNDLNDKVRRFIPINQQCLDLGVLNTNVKAAKLCWREVKNLIDQMVALADKVMSDAENKTAAGDPTKASGGTRLTAANSPTRWPKRPSSCTGLSNCTSRPIRAARNSRGSTGR